MSRDFHAARGLSLAGDGVRAHRCLPIHLRPAGPSEGHQRQGVPQRGQLLHVQVSLAPPWPHRTCSEAPSPPPPFSAPLSLLVKRAWSRVLTQEPQPLQVCNPCAPPWLKPSRTAPPAVALACNPSPIASAPPLASPAQEPRVHPHGRDFPRQQARALQQHHLQLRSIW